MLGSPDPFLAQIDGLGGASSSTSKVSVIGPSAHPGADLDFLFGQVDVRTGRVDYSGSCGNMVVGAALFGVLQGLGPKEVAGGVGRMQVRQVNTGKDVTVALPCSDRREYLSDQLPFQPDGVPFPQPRLQVRYHRPGRPPHSSIFSHR